MGSRHLASWIHDFMLKPSMFKMHCEFVGSF